MGDFETGRSTRSDRWSKYRIMERRTVPPTLLDVIGGLVLLAIAALLVGVALIVAAS